MVYVHNYNQLFYEDTNDELKDIIPVWFKADGIEVQESPTNQNIKVTKSDTFLSNDIGYLMIDRHRYTVAWGNSFLKTEFSTKQLSSGYKIAYTKTEYGLIDNMEFTLYNSSQKEIYTDSSYINVGCTKNTFILLKKDKTLDIKGSSDETTFLNSSWLNSINNVDIEDIIVNDYDIVLFYKSSFMIYSIRNEIIQSIKIPLFDLRQFINNPIYSSVKSSNFIRKAGMISNIVSNDYLIVLLYANKKVNIKYKTTVLSVHQPIIPYDMFSDVYHICATSQLVGFIYGDGKVTIMKFVDDKNVRLFHLENCLQVESTDTDMFVLMENRKVFRFDDDVSKFVEFSNNKHILFPSRQAICMADLKNTYRYVDSEEVRRKLGIRCADHSLSRKLERYNARTIFGFDRNIRVRKRPNKKEL